MMWPTDLEPFQALRHWTTVPGARGIRKDMTCDGYRYKENSQANISTTLCQPKLLVSQIWWWGNFTCKPNNVLRKVPPPWTDHNCRMTPPPLAGGRGEGGGCSCTLSISFILHNFRGVHKGMIEEQWHVLQCANEKLLSQHILDCCCNQQQGQGRG